MKYAEKALELSVGVDSTPDIEHAAEVGRRIFDRLDYNPSALEVARLSTLGKSFCSKESPNCDQCPLRQFCLYGRAKRVQVSKLSIPFIDMFCGAGGLSIGLENSGFHPVLAVDHDKSAVATYLFNRPWLDESVAKLGQIEDFSDGEDLPQVPLVVGGPPCQGFSNANQQRLRDDPRNRLYRDFIRIVDGAKAKICIMENVTGMLKRREEVEADFLEIGFEMHPFLIDAKNLGFPQNRARVFWFGHRTNDVFFFNQLVSFLTHQLSSPNACHPVGRLWDAIGDLPALAAKTAANQTALEEAASGYTIAPSLTFDSPYAKLINGGVTESFLLNHRSKYNNPRDIEIYKRLSPGQNSNAKEIEGIMPYPNRAKIFQDKFFKLDPDCPCKTITAHMYYDCHMYIHPTQARGLTPREAARVQGFPDDYFFLGYPNEWYRQIGNSVSPLVSTHLSKALGSLIQEFGESIL